MKKFFYYALASISALAVMLCLVIGFSHTEAGRPYLGSTVRQFYGLFATGGFCPLGFDQVLSAEQRSLRRENWAAGRAAKPSATLRAFLEINLGLTTRTEFKNWIAQQSGECKDLKSTFEIECSGALLNSKHTTFWLEFDGADRLVSLRGINTFAQPAIAAELFKRLLSELESEKNLSVALVGTPEPRALQGLLSQASATSEASNFRANLRITNMGDNFAVTHEYLAF